MTTLAQIRKAALALPETEEGTRLGTVSFAVRGKGFASVSKDGVLEVWLPTDRLDQVLNDLPDARRLERSGKPFGIAVPVTKINGQTSNHLVRQAWLIRAPKTLAAVVAEAETATAGTVGDLPKAIGRTATRALAGEGLTSLDQLAALTESELTALHGVGPKAVRILAKALTERGLSFR